MPTWRRLIVLAICVLFGAGAGATGYYFTDSEVWFLAVPLAVAVGWLAIADPTECRPR